MARNEELEARLIAAPDDTDAYLVYADWLSQHGDVRGELIVIQDRLQSVDRLRADEARLLREQEAALLGPLIPLGDRNWEVEWDRGFVRAVTMRPRSSQPAEFGGVVHATLAHPSFALLRSLTLTVGEGLDTPLSSAVDGLRLPGTLRHLSIGCTAAPTGLRGPLIGRPMEALERAPHLETLHLHGYAELAASQLANLRSVTLFGGAAQAGDLLALERQSWPALERLVLSLGDARWDPDEAARELLPVLARSFPNLVDLTLAQAMPGPTLDALLESPLLSRLRRLGLVDGSADVDTVQSIALSPARFDHLEVLDLSGNGLTEPTLADLSVLSTRVEVGPGAAAALVCSFCGRPQAEVQRLIAGPGVFICDQCVGLSADILAEGQQ